MKRYSIPGRRWGRLCVNSLETRDNPAAGFEAFGAAAGGLPLVDVVGPDGANVVRFAAYDAAFRGGVRAAVAEIDGNAGTVEVITGAGPGGGPHVKVFRIDPANDNAVAELTGFFAFEPGFTGGVRVAAGNVGGADARDEVIVAADAGGGPRIRVFGLDGSTAAPIAGPLSDFFAFEPDFLGGVRVSAGELNGNSLDGDELLVAAGPGGGPRVRTLRSDGAELANFFAFREGFRGGANVSVDGTGVAGQPLIDALAADVSQRNTRLNAEAATAADATGGGTPGAGAATTAAGANTGGTFTTGGGLLTGTGLNTAGGFGTGFGSPGLTSPILIGGSNGTGVGTGPSFGSIIGAGQTGLGTFGSPTGAGVGTTPFTAAGLGAGVSGFGTSGIGPTFGPLGTEAFGAVGGFGPFGDPGPLTPFPGLLSPPFAGPFTGFGSGVLGAVTNGIVTGSGVVPAGR